MSDTSSESPSQTVLGSRMPKKEGRKFHSSAAKQDAGVFPSCLASASSNSRIRRQASSPHRHFYIKVCCTHPVWTSGFNIYIPATDTPRADLWVIQYSVRVTQTVSWLFLPGNALLAKGFVAPWERTYAAMRDPSGECFCENVINS